MEADSAPAEQAEHSSISQYAEEGVLADAGKAVGKASQREGVATEEGVQADAGKREAVREARQREVDTVLEGALADAGDAVGEAGERQGVAIGEGVLADAGETVG